jgi:hypothetical protein
VESNPVRYQFARPIKDVRIVELISGTIPANPFVINKYNNKFTFREGTTLYNVSLTPDIYTPDTLAAHVQSCLRGLRNPSIRNIYSCSVSASGKFTTTATGSQPFSYLFATGNILDDIDRSDGYFLTQNTPATILGFDLSDYTDISGSLIAPSQMDMRSSLTRLYLFINLNNTQNLGCIERGAGRRAPFAIIYLDEQKDGYKFLNKDTLTPASYSLPQPFSRLQNLDIEFRDEWHRLVDFAGKDFSLLLQFTVLE